MKLEDIIEDSLKKLDNIVAHFRKYGSGILVINNFEVPTYSPAGILGPKEDRRYFDSVRKLNDRVAEYGRHNSVYIFDYDSFAAEIGKRNMIDYRLMYLADMKVSQDIIPQLCEEYMRFVKALKGLTKKCIVLDLDNTLWGGIVGEDGFDGIKLGPTPPGNIYMEFQQRILALFNRGTILAVNSNNNEKDAMEVLKRHPYMILREHNFASLKINWNSKIKNLKEIAREVNIGLDSMVFLDDDKRIRQIVREALPEVLCPELPENPSDYPEFLINLKCMDALQITQEDKKRGRLYATERKRKESTTAFSDISKYLEHLNIITEVKAADKFSIPRLSQLTLRTNQFNFSTKRYSEQEMQNMARDKKYDIYYVRVKDKYGDYGITGAVVILKDMKEWFVDTFLLSCRILGKNIEHAVMSTILEKASKGRIERIAIDYRKTEKNEPVSRFLKELDITIPKAGSKDNGITLYEKGKDLDFRCKTGHIKIISL